MLFTKLLALCSVLGLVGAGLTPVSVCAVEGAHYTVEQWKRIDIVLKSAKSYDNAFWDVEIQAVFTHTESGTQISLPGFWNGGDEWKVRFSPTLIGQWTYMITCSDAANQGLHQQSGVVIATANTGSNEIDKHGWIRLEAGKRYYTYNDGTPFYWLGDTHWQAFDTERLDECNYPGCDCGNQFEHMVNKRVEQGYNVYQTYPSAADNDGGGSKIYDWWEVKNKRIDPAAFNESFDTKMNYIADSGMTIALGLGVHTSTTNGMSEEALLKYTRYVVARYASYPLVWITGQEITAGTLVNDPVSYETWKKVAALINELDGYNHPLGTHLNSAISYDKATDLDAQPWHEWWALQAGHVNTFSDDQIANANDNTIEIKPQAFYKSYWDSPTQKLYMETESNYEDLRRGSITRANGYENTRIGAWKANQCGSYGFTYGVMGVWGMRWSTKASEGGWVNVYNSEPWYMGLEKPGGQEMGYMKNFYEYVGFENLTPRFGNAAYCNFSAEREKSVISTNGNLTYVVYFYGKSTATGSLCGLDDSKKYTANWYNPRTGNFVFISDSISIKNGRYKMQDKPDSKDWVLLVTSENLGSAMYEKGRTAESLPDNSTAITGAKIDIQTLACVSTAEDSQLGALTDGDVATAWRPFCISSSNIINMDLSEKKNLGMMRLTFEKGIDDEYQYRLYGSNDGSTWYVITDRIGDTAVILSSEQPTVLEKIEGGYRYLKLNIFGGADFLKGKAVAGVTELELYEGSSVEDQPGLQNHSAANDAASATFVPVGNADRNNSIKILLGAIILGCLGVMTGMAVRNKKRSTK